MKHSLLVLTLMAAFATSANAQSRGSEDFSLAVASGAALTTFSAALVLSSPFLIVADLSEQAQRNSTTVRVRDEKGNTATMELPKSAVEKAQLKPGDQLAVERRASGALLTKNQKPVAYVLPEANAGLSKTHELAR